MTIRCVACGNVIEIPDNPALGQHFLCPYCNVKLAYWGPTRITRVTDVKKKSGMGPVIILGVLVVLAVVGLVAYKSRLEAQRARERIASEEQRVRDEAEAQKKKNEQEALEEANRKRRAEQREKEESERKRRREEMEKRDAEREKQRQEAQDRADSERRARALFEEAKNGFVGIASVIAADFPEEKSPLSLKSDGRFFVVGSMPGGEQKVYEILVEGGKLLAVRLIARTAGVCELGPDEFRNQLSEVAVVRGESGLAWICGKVKSRMSVDVPEIGSGVLPVALFLGDGYAVAKSLGVTLPEVKYRVTLQNGKNVGDLQLGIFAASESVSAEIVRSKVRERLTEQMLKKAGKGLTPPKMKKIKRTVVFYEGEKIFKAMNGVTKVPRSFKFFGTSRYNDNKSHVNDIIERARRQWESLSEEAKRQDDRELEVEAQNRRAQEEYQRRLDEAIRNARASSDDIDNELKNCKLLIERSKSKLKKTKAER